jgi:hypothetical protein
MEIYRKLDSIEADPIDFDMTACASLLLRSLLQFVNFSEIFGMATK